eukprot:2448189-Rhodomonas_salina.1
MHTVITGTTWKGDCERTDAVLVPAGISPEETLFYQTRLLCNDNTFWDSLQNGIRNKLTSHLLDSGTFADGWNV